MPEYPEFPDNNDPVIWSPAEIADVIQQGLFRKTADFDRDQAVYGIDALSEVQLHAVLQNILSEAGYGVFPEQRYPADRNRRRRSEGERCDIVLTPDSRVLAVPAAQASLFAPADPVCPGDAFWVEVKVVAQFTDEGANHNYSSELMEPVRRDVRKLAKDKNIHHAAVLLVMHTAGKEVAEHDMGVWLDRCLEKELPVGSPYMRHIPITDRMGNKLTTIALYPVLRINE